MSYRFIHVKTYKRGATWPDGSPRMCVRCGRERNRRARAIVTAVIKYSGSKYELPVAYCEEHAYRLEEGGEES